MISLVIRFCFALVHLKCFSALDVRQRLSSILILFCSAGQDADSLYVFSLNTFLNLKVVYAVPHSPKSASRWTSAEEVEHG